MAKKHNWSGERLETHIYADVSVEHLHRYALAATLAEGKTVVDIASGEGYGSALLAKVADAVTGVDIDPDSVTSASKKYMAGNLTFRQGSADKMPVDDAAADMLVSFETIEHHDRHEEMFKEIRRALRPGGLLIMSSPDKKYYSDIPKKQNPFHVKELYADEFEALCSRHFRHTAFYSQNSANGNSVVTRGKDFSPLRVFTGDFDRVGIREFPPMYNIIVASDNPLPDLGESIFEGSGIAARTWEENLSKIRKSATYRAGRLLVAPVAWLQQKLKR